MVYAPRVPFPIHPPPRWPGALARALDDLRGAAPGPAREAARDALWPLLHAALHASLRAQAGRVAPVSREDLEDLASQKALELSTRAEEGTWDTRGRADHEVAGYVARVARHALVDLARRAGRSCAPPEDADAWAAALAEATDEPPRPEDALVAREFARALVACAEALAPRARAAWFGRVFLERPSRELAATLGVNAAHVDVIVQRARAALRACMKGRGHADEAPRVGAFADVWWPMMGRAGMEPMGAVDEGEADDGHDDRAR
jgi:RNA polymerase sigma-70 factor, ECF subfamily